MSVTSKHTGDSRLWLALRFVDLPLNVLAVDAKTDRAIVVNEKQHVVAMTNLAHAAGVTYAMDITTARLLTNCEERMRDGALEKQVLEQLAEQLYQFTPYIETYSCPAISQAGLLLEISSCLQLFSGSVALSRKIFAYLQTTPYSFVAGLAHSAQAAWLLSFADYAISGNENKTLFCERLKVLPIDLLHDHPKAVEALNKTGFATLGDIAKQIEAQSISSIKKRLGPDFAEKIADLFGIDHHFQQDSLFVKPAALYQPSEYFSEALQFDYPIDQIEQLHTPMEILLDKLSVYLRKHQYQCQHIEWMLCDIYHNREILQVHSDNAQSSGKLFHELSHIQLEQRQLAFAVDTLELRCYSTSPVQNLSQSLDFNRNCRADRRTHNFATTAARLKARLGNAAMFKLSYSDSHFPETSNSKISLGEKSRQQLPAVHANALRPTWLLPSAQVIEERPQGLYWRGYLQLILGPERIQGNWWNSPSARDYFLALRRDQVRLWVFHDLHKKHWFVQGIFA